MRLSNGDDSGVPIAQAAAQTASSSHGEWLDISILNRAFQKPMCSAVMAGEGVRVLQPCQHHLWCGEGAA